MFKDKCLHHFSASLKTVAWLSSATIWIPESEDPSLRPINMTLFWALTVRTHPSTLTTFPNKLSFGTSFKCFVFIVSIVHEDIFLNILGLIFFILNRKDKAPRCLEDKSIDMIAINKNFLTNNVIVDFFLLFFYFRAVLLLWNLNSWYRKLKVYNI